MNDERSTDRVRQVLHVVQLATLCTQMPLAIEELKLIWEHPDIAEKIVTLPEPPQTSRS